MLKICLVINNRKMRLLLRNFIFWTYILLFVNSSWATGVPQTADTVVLQLKWKHQFQFAGYYAAIEKGFYNKAGLVVKLLEAENSNESIPLVINGKAQYGVATSDLLLSRNAGIPVVLLANIFQHSPQIFLTLKHDNSDNIHDMAGSSIMLEPHAAELLAYLKTELIPTENIKFIPHTFSPEALINGEVYAISAYSTDEPFLLKNSHIEYNIFNPRSSGIDFYGDVLFTSETEIHEHPNRVKAFLDASLKGWDYALKNEDEIIDLIYNKYSKRHTKEHLKFEAEQTKRLIMPDVVEIGYVNSNRWQRIGEIYAELNMLPTDFSIKDFVYDRNPKPTYWLVYMVVLIILVVATLASIIALRFYRLNQKLKTESIERRKKEELLTLLEERYRNLTENAPFPIFITKPETGDILYLNQLASEKFEINSQYAIHKQSSMFYVNEADRKMLVEKLHQHGFVRNCEMLMKSASGKEFWVHISSNVITFDQKQAEFSAILDITERFELERKLKKANATKDKFFSIIAHDLRGPIGNLNAFIEIIIERKGKLTSEKLDEYILLLKNASQSTFDLLENLLQWALSQKGELLFTPEQQNLYVLVQSNIDLFTGIANSKSIKITNLCSNELCFVFDKAMINTVIRNLLNNAIKYSHPQGHITISASIENDSLMVSVKDNGVGMDEVTIQNLFEVKNKSQSAIGTIGEKGTGLGLVLCADFVQKHGGKIWAESEAGKGSDVKFTLPPTQGYETD